MRIIVEIPDESYRQTMCRGRLAGLNDSDIYDMIIKGEVISSEKYGRLIDADCLYAHFSSSPDVAYSGMYIQSILDKVDTIVPASN